ncbi:MAG: hypothetical protein AAE983_06810, partial [Thermoplasmataceae archaeon]
PILKGICDNEEFTYLIYMKISCYYFFDSAAPIYYGKSKTVNFLGNIKCIQEIYLQIGLYPRELWLE